MTTLLDDIRKLYFGATAKTIEADFDRAIDLIKAMASEEERERAAVFMEGLAELKKQWAGSRPAPAPPKPAGHAPRDRAPQKKPATRR
jgi:hypothetical protein